MEEQGDNILMVEDDKSNDVRTQLTSSHHSLNNIEKQFDYVDKEKIDQDLICSICSNPFINPHTHKLCDNTFCFHCIESVKNCPMCGEADFSKNCFTSPKVFINFLEKLKVKCSICKKIVSRGELKIHKEKYCPLNEAYKQVEELKLKLENEFNEKNQLLKLEHEELIQKLKDENEQFLTQAKQNLILKEQELMQQFKLKEELLEKEKVTREKFEMSNKPIHLNVRGTIMTVSLGDFIHNERESENVFKKLFTGEYPLYETPSNLFKDPIYFIDCDLMIFKYILDWLKFGRVGNELSTDMKNSILDTGNMFGLHNLTKQLTQINNYQKEKMKMSQFDFMNLTNLSRSQKITLNLSGLDLRGLVLQNTNLEKSEIISSDFSGMNLKEANFKGSILRGSNFSNCDLTGVNFRGCNLSECNFSDAILKNTNMSNSNLSDAIFENSQFEETKFKSCKFSKTKGMKSSKLTLLDFTKSKFDSCDLFKSNLSNSKFINCNFTDCNLENTNLKNSNFSNSRFNDIKFNSECNFEGSVLKNSSLQNVSGLTDLVVIAVDFSNCKLFNTELNFCSIEDSSLTDSCFKVSNNHSKKLIVNCNISGCNLSNQDFSRFEFKNVNFTNTNIDECNFENSLFEKCIIQTHFKKNNNLKDCKLIECKMNGSIFEEIDFKFIESNLLTTVFNECTFKNADLISLNGLSKFNGSKFDSCLLNIEQFTEKEIENIQFENIDFKSQNLNSFKFKNTEFSNCKIHISNVGVISSSIIGSIGPLVLSELYSNTKSQSIPQLLYRGTRDGFNANDFHSKCDNQGPTMTIIKSEHNQIFGGFTNESWKSPQFGEYISDSSAFIFKITNSNGNYQFQKFNIKQNLQQYAMVVNKGFLPIFGGGHDIRIYSDCNLNNNSKSNFGNTYELPNGYQYESNEAKNYLAGSNQFKVVEIEVFKINQ